MGKNKQVSCKICFKTVRSDNLKRHMKVHVVYTSPEVQVENSEEICRDIIMEIVDKVCVQDESATERKDGELNDSKSTRKRKLTDDGNNTISKRKLDEDGNNTTTKNQLGGDE